MGCQHLIKEVSALRHSLCLPLAQLVWQGASTPRRRTARDRPQKHPSALVEHQSMLSFADCNQHPEEHKKSLVGKPVQFTGLALMHHAHMNGFIKWKANDSLCELGTWLLEIEETSGEQHGTVLEHCTAPYSLKIWIRSRVLIALGKMRALWDSKVSHDSGFICQEKHIIHNRWESQPAFLGSARSLYPTSSTSHSEWSLSWSGLWTLQAAKQIGNSIQLCLQPGLFKPHLKLSPPGAVNAAADS